MEKVIERLRVVLRRVLQIARVLGVCGRGVVGGSVCPYFILWLFFNTTLPPAAKWLRVLGTLGGGGRL